MLTYCAASLSDRPRFPSFWIAIVTAWVTRSHESEASRYAPWLAWHRQLEYFFQNTKLPPNLPNRAMWLAESGMQDDVPAYAPGHNSSCLQVSLPCHALSGMTETCKDAS